MPERPRRDISISKDVLPELPEEYIETSLGDRRGAKKQFRSRTSSVHVREYRDRLTIHIDRVNPESNPVGHLLRDSPETIAAAVASFLVARKKIRKSDTNSPESSFPRLEKLGPIGFLTIFMFLNGALRLLKELLLR